MSNLTQKIFYPFSHLKRFIFVTLLMMTFFFIFLFPLTEIGDLITARISQATNGRFYLQSKELKIGFYPSIGLKAKDITMSIPLLNQIKFHSITLSPHIPALLQLKPGASIYIEGLYDGFAKISMYHKRTTEQGGMIFETDLNLGDNNLEDLPLPSLPLSGKIRNLHISGDFDPQLTEQPDMEIAMTLDRIYLQGHSIQTPLGPFSLPPIQFQSVLLQGKINNNSLTVRRLQLGGDEVSATLRGKMDMELEQRGVNLGAYDFNLNLQTSAQFESKFKLFLAFLRSYKKMRAAGGGQYNLRISAARMGVPPQLSTQ